MPRRHAERAYSIVDVLVGLALLALVMVSIYRLYIPTLTLSRSLHGGLEAQQDVRLAVDRVARAIHETTAAWGRLRLYPAESGCRGAYEGCIAFVTARDGACVGAFRLAGGAPDWQATIYLWRDTASNELRLYCDTASTFPTTEWPPPLGPHTVIATHVTAASFSLRFSGNGVPTAVAVALEEQSSAPAQPRSPYPTAFFNRTVFFPQNR